MQILKLTRNFCLLLGVAMCFSGCFGRGDKLVWDEYSTTRSVENDSVRFFVDISIDFPKNNSRGAVADSLRHFLSMALFSIECPDNADRMVEQYIDTVYSNYCLDMRDFRRAAGFTDAFREEIMGSANQLNDSLLCYDKAVYLYYGGAQGQRRVQSYVFNLHTGRLITEDDMLKADMQQQLAQLIAEALAQYTQEEAMQTIEPNGNFLVLPEGLIWRYDGYELNTFEIPAVESVDLQIPAEKILPLLKEDGLVYKFLKSQNTETK